MSMASLFTLLVVRNCIRIPSSTTLRTSAIREQANVIPAFRTPALFQREISAGVDIRQSNRDDHQPQKHADDRNGYEVHGQPAPSGTDLPEVRKQHVSRHIAFTLCIPILGDRTPNLHLHVGRQILQHLPTIRNEREIPPLSLSGSRDESAMSAHAMQEVILAIWIPAARRIRIADFQGSIVSQSDLSTISWMKTTRAVRV